MDAGPIRIDGLIGVVLAGGRSRRLGRDKATLELDGETLAARACRKLGEATAEVLLADGGRGLLGFTVTSIPDGPGRGPAAGLLGTALARPAATLLVLACDLPLVTVKLLEALAATAPAADLVVPRWSGGVEPLCARYGPTALDALARRVVADRLDLHTLAGQSDIVTHYLEAEALAACGSPAELFRNLNTPEDLQALLD